MSENINYEMSTKYKPEFKKFLTYQKLYETIDTESKYDLFDSREIFTRRDKSGIFNKLKNLLHFNIKDYDKNDEERFNILKLMYFIIDIDNHNEIDKQKSVSIIDLMAKPTIEHTDAKNSVYEEHFRNRITELRKGVNDPDYRENKIERIHKNWNQLFINIQLNIIEEIQLKNNDFKKMCIFFKKIG